MKFSNKDLLLLFGILIAVIVTLTTMVYSERTGALNKASENIKPNTSMLAPGPIQKAIDKIEFNSLIR